LGDTAAVNSRDLPKVEGFCDEVTAIEVGIEVEIPVTAMLSSAANDRSLKATEVPGVGNAVPEVAAEPTTSPTGPDPVTKQ
jgi:hypothetical protein